MSENTPENESTTEAPQVNPATGQPAPATDDRPQEEINADRGYVGSDAADLGNPGRPEDSQPGPAAGGNA